jgi:hypothetical protein
MYLADQHVDRYGEEHLRMETQAIVVAAAFLAVPISIKYLLAFHVRNMVDDLKHREKEVRALSAQLQALEQEMRVIQRATVQVQSQFRRAQTHRSMAEERLGHVLRSTEQAQAA